MKVIIYGCGARAQIVLDSVTGYVKIVGAYDKDRRKALEFCERNHLQYVEMNSYSVKDEIVLVTSDKYYDEIYLELKSKGICESEILNIYGLNKSIVKKMHSYKECNICNSKVFDWMFTGENNAGTAGNIIIGGGYRRGQCPVCGCNDRERFAYDYIKNEIDTSDKSILHFAPEQKLREYLSVQSTQYITADLRRGCADTIEDIRNLSFKNNQFDVIICNHVLEHVDNDRKALLEIYRCLAPNGIAIITSPICWEMNTIENKHVNTDEERIELYGQADHVRLYGKDFEERLRTVGFNVKCTRCQDIERANRHGFIVGDTIFVCKKIHQ